MIFSKNNKIMKSSLGCHAVSQQNARWFLKHDDLIDLTLRVGRIVSRILNKKELSQIFFFKLNQRKAIFRIADPRDLSKTYVAKVFFLNHLSHKINYHKYALDEAANLVVAHKRGLNVPELIGYGHIYSPLRLVRASIVLTEELSGFRTIEEVFKNSPGPQQIDVFMKTKALFTSLYQAKCNHIDLNLGTVMLGENLLGSEIFLLDFQHALFYDSHSLEILMFEAGSFARFCKEWISSETVYAWVKDILASIGVKDSCGLKNALVRFEHYYHLKDLRPHEKRMSRKKRRRIR